MKKIFAVFLSLLLLLHLASCAKDKGSVDVSDSSALSDSADNEQSADDTNDDSDIDEDDKGSNDDKAIVLNKNTPGIKILGGRGIASDTQINCDPSGSGIEFIINNRSSSLMIEATSSAVCRFKVFVNGDLHKNAFGSDYHEINRNGIIILQNLPTGEVTVRVIKITDQYTSTAQLTKLSFDGEIKTDSAPTDRELYIEFIGGSELSGAFASDGAKAEQDITGSYGYLLAEKMEADYSIFSLSSNMALTKTADVAAFYSKASPARDTDAIYDFSRKANVVVVDLGSVDAALSATDATITSERFAEKYEMLLDAIREKNGETCKIICVYTPGEGEFGTAIKDVCKNKMGGQSGGVYTCQRSTGANGILGIQESIDFCNKLKTYVEAAIIGKLIEGELTSETNGDGLKVSFKDNFVPISK